ncbi:MAG: hypothetical protein JWR80_8259 [Bradyrhizobium sp.]|nr:hypothetical protein [Bradyrhizobium sp.]
MEKTLVSRGRAKRRIVVLWVAISALTAVQAAPGTGIQTQPPPEPEAFAPQHQIVAVSLKPATISGTVSASVPLVAAKVRAFNLDRRIMYLVFTNKGHFQAAGLIPGKYEISVEKNGFITEKQNADITAGQSLALDFNLKAGGPAEFLIRAEFPYFSWQTVSEYAPYDTIYPKAAARRLVETNCLSCHVSETFIPAHPRTRAEWVSTLDQHARPWKIYNVQTRLLGGARPGDPLIPHTTFTAREKTDLVDYLSAHFGHGPKRGVRMDPNALPLDEDALGKAMYVEYYLPLDAKLDATNTRRRGQDPRLDRNGNVWYTDNSYPARIGKLDPRTGTFVDYLLASPKAYPHGITIDRAGDVWWAERDNPYLGRLNPTNGMMIRYPADPNGKIEGPWWAHTPVVDSQQNIWFSNIGTNSISEWDRKTGAINSWSYATTWGRSYGMTADSADNIWFTENLACKIAKFDQTSHQFTEYSALKPPCGIRRLSVDEAGFVWYAVFSAGALGRLDPKTGQITERHLPTRFSSPYDVQPDGHGLLWMGDGAMGGALVSFDPKTGKFSYYPSPQITDMPRLDISPAGAVWYAARSGANSAMGVLYPDISKFPELWH